MADLKFTNEKGQKFEVSGLTVEEIQQLTGLNGYHRNGSSSPIITKRVGAGDPNYEGFKKKLSPKAKQFLSILSQNPQGISADHLSDQLGFTTGVQLGGMAGGGLSKHSARFHVDLSNVYTREIKFESGTRVVIYKPGRDINRLL